MIHTLYPSGADAKYELQTKAAAAQLIDQYKDALGRLIRTYLHDVIDADSRLVRRDLVLSGVRDGIKRSSSFYDNVIAWSTVKLAGELGLYQVNNRELAEWKRLIVSVYWDDGAGVFTDEPPELVVPGNSFSADSLIVLETGFLRPALPSDRFYLSKIVSYIRRNRLDKPFPLQYSAADVPDKLHGPVRYFARSYMGRSIWSHWGIEYIKLLVLLGEYDQALLDLAGGDLNAYKRNMEKHGGYPELYHTNAKLYSTLLYRSVLRTSWVINYEQAKMLLAHVRTVVTSGSSKPGRS